MASSKTPDPALRGASPWQRLLTQGHGIPMPSARELADASEELALFTPEERRELRRAASEQCEANR